MDTCSPRRRCGAGRRWARPYRAVLGLADAVAPGKRLTGQAVHVTASDNRAALIAFGEDPLTIHAPRH